MQINIQHYGTKQERQQKGTLIIPKVDSKNIKKGITPLFKQVFVINKSAEVSPCLSLCLPFECHTGFQATIPTHNRTNRTLLCSNKMQLDAHPHPALKTWRPARSALLLTRSIALMRVAMDDGSPAFHPTHDLGLAISQ